MSLLSETPMKGHEALYCFDKNYAELNGKPIEMDTHRFYSDLITIMSRWKHDMGGQNTLDGIEYYVKIEKDGKKYVYEGKTSFRFHLVHLWNCLPNTNYGSAYSSGNKEIAGNGGCVCRRGFSIE